MKWVWLFVVYLCVPLAGWGLTFDVTDLTPADNPDVLGLSPRGDLLQEPGAVLFVRSRIPQLSVRGAVLTTPRRVRDGFIVFVAQGAQQLTLQAPLYASQTVRFDPVEPGKHYTMTVRSHHSPAEIAQAARQAHMLDIGQDRIPVQLSFDYMDVPGVVKQDNEYTALVYLDKTLSFKQWKKLLRTNGPYKPFDVNGNKKEPCCILVRAGEPVENVFKLKVLEWDSYVQYLEDGNTYHTQLSLPLRP